MVDFRDKAKTCLMLLANASGAEFEDEKLAVDILEETIVRTVKQVLKDKEELLIDAFNDTRHFDKRDARIITKGVLKL